MSRLDLSGTATREALDVATSAFDSLVELEPAPGFGYAGADFRLRDAVIRLFGRDVDLVTLDDVKSRTSTKPGNIHDHRWMRPES